MADWSELPRDLLDLISRKIDILRDYRQFGAVCSSWRSVAIKNPWQCQFQSFPKLVIPGEIKNSETRQCLEAIPDNKGYFSFCKSINEKASQKKLSVPHQYYCCGSNSLGWLVLINNSFEMQLFNPLSEVKFKLPSSKTLPPANEGFTRFCKYYVNKAVISSDPTYSTSSHQTIVLIIYAGAPPRLAFCKLGDESWTPIETPNRNYLDAIYYKDKFYAVYNRGGCDIIDIIDNQAAVEEYALRPPEEQYTWDLYVIESKGELYLAVRILRYDDDSDYGSDSGSGSEGDEDDNLDNEGHNDYEDNKSGNRDHHKSHEDDENDHNDGADNKSDNSDHKSHENDDDSDDDDHKHGADNDSDNDDDHNDGTDNKSDNSDPDRYPIFIDWYRTVRFRVYKLEEGEKDGIKKWTRMKSIGDNAFFVGSNSSFALQASDYFGCCKPNSIYFTDSHKPVPWIKPIRHDIGIFNLENKSVDSIFPVDFKPVRPPPFWFTPNV
ncbi:hypothetical protein FRX31_013142 [Thalictrum thalictroides]|uniref:KIB1-4 beta-propeller domain-containing protein n=1 Tax=Thalictrum thalictroides TaxID=46969 RepID=A0A7J6WK11_THATH|nr:hypothetical protein FRX31_013142 [Thalictrum thalictroides]